METHLKFQAVPDEENLMKHEDAFKAANLHAGKVVNLVDILQSSTPLTAPFLIESAQNAYEFVFAAFIAGVDYGRTNPTNQNSTALEGE